MWRISDMWRILDFLLYTNIHHMYIYTYLLIFGFGGGLVEQPPLGPIEKALY